MKTKRKTELLEMESRMNQLLTEKMELEYRFQELKDNFQQERDQREEILRLHENARRLKHDMKNHIMVIAAYLQAGENEEAAEYLSHVLDELNGIYTYIETGNSLLSHVLNQKLEQAHNRGVQVKAQIENLAFAKMESVDFVSLLSNLMDNAVEGAVSENAQPQIHVEVTARRGYDTIQVKNSISKSVLENNPDLKSTKEKKDGEEAHGYGVTQIRRIVEKYEGLFQFYEKDDMFCAVAMIPSVSQDDAVVSI